MAQAAFNEAQKQMIEEFVHKLFEHEMTYESDASTLCKFLGISETRLKKEIQKSLKTQVNCEVEEFKKTRLEQMNQLLAEIVGESKTPEKDVQVAQKSDEGVEPDLSSERDSSTESYPQLD